MRLSDGLRDMMLIALVSLAGVSHAAEQCAGSEIKGWNGIPKVWKMSTGIAVYGKMNINIDGYERAYHRRNYETDAVIHLCNAGQVYLPSGASYHGSESNSTCVGRFMDDLARIEKAGWKDPAVGAIRWYGVLGTGTATVGGKKITGVIPVAQSGGSGYYVSPTALYDKTVTEAAEQSRYVNPLKIPAAVIPGRLQEAGIRLGSFGVAISRKTKIAVPFVVGDIGPRIGEGTPALARQLAGLPLSDVISRKDRFSGQVDTPSILWVYFGDEPAPYKQSNPEATIAAAKAAYERWGGAARLQSCQQVFPKP